MKASIGLFVSGREYFFNQPLIFNIYGPAPEPDSANDAASGMLLVSFKNIRIVNVNGIYKKLPDDVWSAPVEASEAAEATYFRLVLENDHGGMSRVLPRIQGSVGEVVVHDHVIYPEKKGKKKIKKRTIQTFVAPDLILSRKILFPDHTLTIGQFQLLFND
jgi:hypothetical protein